MINPISNDAYQLFHDGVLAFAEIEAVGIRVDIPYLKEQQSKLDNQILVLEKELWKQPEVKQWKNHFKDKINLNSTTQLSIVLYKILHLKPTKSTAKGHPAVDDEVLQQIDLPFVETILTIRKLIKVRDTYLASLLREEINGFLHPSFNLHLVSTYRSSSDSPNFQNIPVRDPEQGGVVRRGILPLNDNHIIGEVDYSGIEVRIAACYHKDPVMLEYIHDPSKDMHRDMAAKCYCLPLKEVGKKIRYCGKNGFVFPEFYGSYYENVAPSMWKMIDEHSLKTESGVPLKKWLAEKGIPTLSRFKDHIQDVENWFWQKRFSAYNEWKKQWYQSYVQQGWFDTLSGFRCTGPMRRNEVINYPVQGSAFHCLLWSLIQIHRWLTVNEMESKVIGQVHDSIIFSFHPDELQTVLQKTRKVMCEDVRKHWPWIIVPLDIETELAPVGKSWNEKKKVDDTENDLGNPSYNGSVRSHPGKANHDHSEET